MRGLLRKAVTLIWGIPHSGHFSSTASILPFGNG